MVVMIMMMFAIPPVVIEVIMVAEIMPVFPVEAGVIMFIIDPVVIVSMPCGIRIIAISRIRLFVDANLHVHLGAGGIDGERPCSDHSQKK